MKERLRFGGRTGISFRDEKGRTKAADLPGVQGRAARTLHAVSAGQLADHEQVVDRRLPPPVDGEAPVAVLVAVTIALYLLAGSYTRRTTVAGELVPAQGLATVLAPAAGVVSELHADEGLEELDVDGHLVAGDGLF